MIIVVVLLIINSNNNLLVILINSFYIFIHCTKLRSIDSPNLHMYTASLNKHT